MDYSDCTDEGLDQAEAAERDRLANPGLLVASSHAAIESHFAADTTTPVHIRDHMLASQLGGVTVDSVRWDANEEIAAIAAERSRRG